MSMLKSDQSLINKALSGSAQAWDMLVTRHEKRVYNYALRMTMNPDDALDLMQDVFVSVFRNLHQFRHESSFPRWLLKIAANRTVDFHRRGLKRQSEFSGDQVFEDIAQTENDPFDDLLKRETNRQIVAMLNQLPSEQRLTVEMKFFQHMTFEEIAQMLEISPNTAKTRLYAGLRKMKAYLEGVHAM